MSIKQARSIIADAARPATFSGAGLSAESGIATFRDAQTGMWATFDPHQLASPEGFDANPDRVIDWYNHRRQMIAQTEPNAAHRALANCGWKHITQNVDDLLHRAGAQTVLQLHGSISIDRCHHHCSFSETIDLETPPARRMCPMCDGPVRPGVVWFGETLPMDVWEQAHETCSTCDVLLVIGTSAVVYPAARLIAVAKDAGAQVIVVNTQPSEASTLADIELIGSAASIIPQLLPSADP